MTKSSQVNFKLSLLLVIVFSLGASPMAFASELFCVQWALSQLKTPTGIMKKVDDLGDHLIKSYHLPINYTSGYFARRIEPILSNPTYTEVLQPEKLYRGMYLSEDQLRNILNEGMKVNKVRWNAAGGGVSFSSNANEAATYIFHAASDKKKGIGVVFEVKMSNKMELADDPLLNATRTIYKSHSDVSRDEIQNVYIWGEHGLESLDEITGKLKNHKLQPHQNWTNIFDRQEGFSR